MKLLLPIKPEHVKSIPQGTKKFAFRKVRTRRPVTCVVMYSTAPVSRIVGEVAVTETLVGSPEEVWQQTAVLSESREFRRLLEQVLPDWERRKHRLESATA